MKFSFRRLGVALGLLALIPAYILYRRAQQVPAGKQEVDGLYLYDAARDRERAMAMFYDNWYWLIGDAEPGHVPFPLVDPAYFLDYRAPSKQPSDRGRETIVVYRVAGKPVGLISYYRDYGDLFRIHFLVVDEACRGKGCSKKLMDKALHDVKELGAKAVWLVTRTDNIVAQKLYRSYGFEGMRDIPGYVRFEKKLDR